MYKLPLAALLAALLAACGQSESIVVSQDEAKTTFANDDERILYALGVAVGQNINDFNLTPDELKIVTQGMDDVVNDTPPRVDMSLYGPQIQQLADRRAQVGIDAEKEASAKFAADVAAEPGAETTDSGLVYVPISEGQGEMPTADSTVRVDYKGTLRDGTVFDSSIERGEPITIPLTGVIPCWTEGMQKIKVGGKAKLLCPSDIAYGDRGAPPTIPGGASLLFEVELLGIE